MIRYELILYRRPNLSVADIPRRMAELPAEFSEGTLQRALEHPDDGAIAIAWGDNRKRLLLIKRRIEILGGSVELRDRAGPFTQKLTALTDRFKGWFREPAADGGRTAGASSRGGLISIALVVGLAIAALVYAHGAHDAHHAHARLYALRGGAFTLGLVSALAFLRGVRRWYDGDGAAWLSALLVLVPTSTLMAAGYQGYKLGLVEQGAAALEASSTASKRPLMKPFQALIVELRHRKQRAELAAVMAEVQESAAGASAEPQPSAAEESAAAAQTPNASSDVRDGAGKRSVGRAASAKRGAVVARAVEADDGGARAWARRAATTIGACMLAASASNAAAATAGSGFAAWTAIRAGVGEIEPLIAAPEVVAASAGVAAVGGQANQPPSSHDADKAAARELPLTVRTPSPQRSHREPAFDEHAREWEPLRSLGDVNVLHVAAALIWSVLTFVLGMWIARRRVARLTPLTASVAVSGSAQTEVARPMSDDASVHGLADRIEPSSPDDARLESLRTTNASPPAAQHEPPSPHMIIAVDPANDARTPPDHASAAIAAASAAAHKAADPVAAKPAKARAAGAARGGIQEETVVRRRPDNRRDD